MVIPKTRDLACTAILVFTCFLPSSGEAKNHPVTTDSFKGIKSALLDPAPYKHPIYAERPSITSLPVIKEKTPLTTLQSTDKTLSGCIETLPYSTASLMDKIGTYSRIMANNSHATIEEFAFRPYFSGLKGPRLTIMRADLERALVHKKASANEIYHNATIASPPSAPCKTNTKTQWDLELRHHVDAWNSDEAPLLRSDAILNLRHNFGAYLLGTVSAKFHLYDNLDREPNLRLLNRPDPIRQDVLGYTWEKMGLNRLMLSGFTTPAKDIYVAGHAGYLEEMFAGIGGEFLYQSYDSAFSFGGEIWGTVKRTPYLGSPLAVDTRHKQTNALLNLWYDAPPIPLSIGLSAGQFLDGDTGYQLRTRYTPAPGWKLESYATYSNQSDATVTKNADKNWIFGARLTMPLGNFKGLPDNSRQTLSLKPFARDHGQRLDTPYPLYDITSAWSSRRIHNDWNQITAE